MFRIVFLLVALASCTSEVSTNSRDTGNERRGTAVKEVVYPAAKEFCAREPWFCANPESAPEREWQNMTLAHLQRVNDYVNGNIVQVLDSDNYEMGDYWTLPQNGRGDCEDIALQKMKTLIDDGIDPRLLMLAIVYLESRNGYHAVLVARLDSGDMVLDNLTSKILPWSETEYAYVIMQSGNDRAKWVSVDGRSRTHAFLTHNE